MPVSFRNARISESSSSDMPPFSSSKEEMSSVLYEGRAILSEMADILAMTEDWRHRLQSGIEGRSWRAVSLAAGLGPGYVFSVLKEGKDPTIGNLAKVCEAAGLSLSYVLFGVDLSRADEESLALFHALPERKKEAFLLLLREQSPALPAQEKPVSAPR